MGMQQILPDIPALKASYRTGRVLALPVNITVSVSYRCNSRCKTCNVWLLPNDDLTLPEWDRVFESLGRAPYWFTFSGGEPTLRKDLPEMVASAYRHCRPGIINIPTNGIQDKIIPGRIERVLQAAPRSEVIINLSLDGLGLKHDAVRGVNGNWARAMTTYAALKELKRVYKHLTLGIHTVISNFNVDAFPELCEFVQRELREQRQVIPCMAGVASAQIAPNGDVWPCCIRAQSMGNVRDHDYDFGSVWRTGKADQLRRSIKAGECHCPLGDAAYTNMLAHPPTVTKVAAGVARSRLASLGGRSARAERPGREAALQTNCGS